MKLPMECRSILKAEYDPNGREVRFVIHNPPGDHTSPEGMLWLTVHSGDVPFKHMKRYIVTIVEAE